MTGEPRWKRRLRAWNARPPQTGPEEALRQIERRIGQGPSRRAMASRRLLAIATAATASALLAIALVLSHDPRRPRPSETAAQHSTIVLELQSGSTLYLTTKEISR